MVTSMLKLWLSSWRSVPADVLATADLVGRAGSASLGSRFFAFFNSFASSGTMGIAMLGMTLTTVISSASIVYDIVLDPESPLQVQAVSFDTGVITDEDGNYLTVDGLTFIDGQGQTGQEQEILSLLELMQAVLDPEEEHMEYVPYMPDENWMIESGLWSEDEVRTIFEDLGLPPPVFDSDTTPPVDDNPVTPPATEDPAISEPPATEEPSTEEPTEEPTEDPTTEEPTTEEPTTEEATTEAPTTDAPTTDAPTTEPLVTEEPPTTETPTTDAPTTEAPTTEAPTTEAPTTEAPTTETPTTEPPTTEPPTTEPPTTQPPTTPPPTTEPPPLTTEPPTTIPEPQTSLTLSTPGGETDFILGHAPVQLIQGGGSGTGAVTYTSSDTSVITVSNSGFVVFEGAGTATVTVTKAASAGYLEASATLTLTVGKRDISYIIITPPSAVTYNGLAQTPTPVITDDGINKLADFEFSYSENTYAGTATVTITPAADSNYTGTPISVDFVINPAVITVTGFNISKPFDGNATVLGLGTLVFSNLQNGETADVNYSGVTATYDNANIGTGKQINITGTFTMTVGTVNPANYTFVQPSNITGSIVLASPYAPGMPTQGSKTSTSVTLVPPVGTNPLFALEYSMNTTSTAPVSGWQDSLTFADLEMGTTYYFFARYKADPARNNASPASPYLQITPGKLDQDPPVTLSAPGGITTFAYGHAPIQFTSSGGVGDGAVTYASDAETVATVSSTGLVTIIGPGEANITVTKAADDVYDASQASLHITVTQGTLTSTPTASAIPTYGGLLSTSNITGTVTDQASYTIPGTWAWNVPTALPKVGTAAFSATFTPTSTVDQAGYASLTVYIDVTVSSPKALTISSATHTKVFDNTTTASSVTVTLSGIVDGDDVSPGTVTAVYTSLSAGTTTINITDVTLTGDDAANYIVTPRDNVTVAGITKATQTLSLTAPGGATSFPFGTASTPLTLTGDSGAGTVTYESDAPGIISVGSTGYVIFEKSGTAMITATIAECTNYFGASATLTLIVGKRDISDVTITPPSAVTYTGSPLTPAPTITDPGVSMNIATDFEISYSSNTNAGTATITITPTETGNYTGTERTVNFTINKATPAYTAPTGLTANYGDLLSSINLTTGWAWVTPTAAVGALGVQQHSATFTPTDTINYNTATVDLDVTVNTTNLGVGTESDPYQIHTAADLSAVGRGNYNGQDWSLTAHYRMEANIVLTPPAAGESNWEPIGGYFEGFTGRFNGNGFTISNLTIQSGFCLGLFGLISRDSIVENIGLIDVDINGSLYIGGIVGMNYGIVRNCFVTGTINGGTMSIGGIVGENNSFDGIGTIENNVALLNEINGGTVGRIKGDALLGGTLNGNYSFSGMLLNDATVTGTTTDRHGADITLTNVATVQAMLNTTFGAPPTGNAPDLNNYLPEPGTAENPFVITTEADLRAVGQGAYAAKNSQDWSLSAHYKMMANVDLTGKPDWIPISDEWDVSFAGVFDGNGHTITGLTINAPGEIFVSMFGNLAGTVRNLGLVDVSILGGFSAGGLAGKNTGTIENVFITGTVSGDMCVGGLIGDMLYGTVQNNVALLSAVSEDFDFLNGRIYADDSITAGINNYAFSGMTINGTTVTSTDPTGNHGADITPANVASVQAMLNATFGANAPDLNNFLPEPGTAENPFVITTEADLRAVGQGTYAAKNNQDWSLSAHYKMMANVSLTPPAAGQSNWTPIDTRTQDGTIETPFTGVFDGNGFTITGLTVNDPEAVIVGLFGQSDGTVKNLGLVDVYIDAAGLIGGIAGSNFGVIENTFITGTISGGMIVGGITGITDEGVVQNSVSLLDSISEEFNIMIGRVHIFAMETIPVSINNYAYAGMLVDGAPISNSDPNSYNGADITATQINVVSWWRNTAFRVGQAGGMSEAAWANMQNNLPIGIVGTSMLLDIDDIIETAVVDEFDSLDYKKEEEYEPSPPENSNSPVVPGSGPDPSDPDKAHGSELAYKKEDEYEAGTDGNIESPEETD